MPRPRQEETPPLKAQLVTDRGLYKEGDEVHVAGYLRAQDGAALALPPADSSGVACALESLIGTCVEYFVSVHWRHGRGAEETKVAVHPGGDGAFTLTLPVPADAAYGATSLQLTRVEHSVGLATRDSHKNSYLATAEVVIADPRPPTVKFDVAVVGAAGGWRRAAR